MQPPDSPREDATLAHQVKFGVVRQELTVGCNCLPRGRWLAQKTRFEPGEWRPIWREHVCQAMTDDLVTACLNRENADAQP